MVTTWTRPKLSLCLPCAPPSMADKRCRLLWLGHRCDDSSKTMVTITMLITMLWWGCWRKWWLPWAWWQDVKINLWIWKWVGHEKTRPHLLHLGWESAFQIFVEKKNKKSIPFGYFVSKFTFLVSDNSLSQESHFWKFSIIRWGASYTSISIKTASKIYLSTFSLVPHKKQYSSITTLSSNFSNVWIFSPVKIQN